MAKQIAIGIKIESQGGEKVLKNLQDLENELGVLSQELKTLDFGTAEFDAATKQINKIKSAIKDVDKATEGLETAQRVQAIGEAVGLVIGSFQILTGIIGLFITNTEDLEKVQRFEAAALSVLNTALGLQTILYQRAELAAKNYSVSQLANEAATKALSFVTKTATAVQLAYNAALKANPIGVIVTSVLALTAAIYGLVKAFKSLNAPLDETKAIAQEVERIELSLVETRAKAAAELKNQLKILTDNIETRELERKTLEDLKKAYPGLNAFISENNKLTEEGIKLIQLKVKAAEAEAALNQIRATITQEEIDLVKEQAENRAIYGFTQQAANMNLKLREQNKIVVAALREEEEKYTKQLNGVLEELKPLNEELDANAKAEAAAAEAAKNAAQQLSKQALEIQKNNRALQVRLSLFQDVLNSLEQTQEVELTYTDDVLDKQNEVLDRQNDLLKNRGDALDRNKQILDDLSELFFQTIPNAQEVQETSGAFFEFFNFLEKGLKEGLFDFAQPIGFDVLLQAFQEGTDASAQLIENLKSIPEETKVSLIEFLNSYDDRLQKIAQLTGKSVLDLFFDPVLLQENLNLLLKVEEQQSQLFKNRIETGYTELEIKEAGQQLILDELGLSEEIVKTQKQISDNLYNINVEKAKGANADQNVIKLLEDQNTTLGNQIETYYTIVDTILEGVVRNNKFRESIQGAQKDFEKQGEQIKKNQELLDQTFDPEALRKYFAGLGEDLETIFPTLILNLQDYLQRFGKEGTEAIIQGVIEGLKEQGKLTRQEAERIVDVLEKAGLALKVLFGSAFDPFAEQLKMLRKLIKGLADESKEIPEAFLKLQDVTQDYFVVLDDLSGRLSDVIAQNNANLLDQLSYEEQVALNQIGEANAATAKENERIEAERAAVQQKYAKARFELEKKARVQELQFALAAAISGGAQAVINALATIPPPLGAVYATGLGLLTGAQIQVISNQLTTAKSKAYIARRGGLVAGTDHEGGGVPALLEGGEFVVNKEAVARYGNLIGELNSSTGGKRLSIDDSRIVQAISSQNQTTPPLKAYVLYNSINNTQKLNNKITQLSRL